MKKNALIVDDSRLACKVMGNMLETLGLSSDSVFSAEAALDYLQYHQPDIIFLDHTMPGMDGLETIKVLKQNPVTATVPVMMYTAKEGEVYVSQARALGAVDVLPKGLEKDYLFNALRKLGLVGEQKTVKTTTVKVDSPLPKPIADKPRVNEQSQLPVWQTLWQQKIEPFLYRQKVQYSEELLHNNQIQTRKLTREFHQTLEHFEHALAHRTESHEDFIRSQQELEESIKSRKTLFTVAFFVIVQLGILWQLWDISDRNQQLLQSQQVFSERQAEYQAQLAQMAKSLLNIKMPVENLVKQNSKVEKQNRVSLVDYQGEVIADLKTDNETGGYQGVSDNGYYFAVSSQGQIGWPLRSRYYLTENCQGDPFVNSAVASIFRDPQNILWYVDKQANKFSVTVTSELDQNDVCTSLAGEILNLHRLLPNVPYETGVDAHQHTELVFYR